MRTMTLGEVVLVSQKWVCWTHTESGPFPAQTGKNEDLTTGSEYSLFSQAKGRTQVISENTGVVTDKHMQVSQVAEGKWLQPQKLALTSSGNSPGQTTKCNRAALSLACT